MNSDTKLSNQLAKYIFRGIISTVGASIYILADSFFVAKSIGVLGVAVMNLTMPLFNVMEGLGLLLGMGGGTLFTIYLLNNKEKSKQIFTQTAVIGAILGLFFTVCSLFFAPEISKLLGADPTTFNYTLQYIRVVLLFGPAFVFNNLLLGFIRNDHGTKIAMIAMLISSLANIFLDWFLILKLNLGIFGASFATSLSPIISILITLTHLKNEDSQIKLVKVKFKIKNTIKIITIGLPSFLTEMSTGFGIFIYNWFFITMSGNDAVAAYGIAANVLLVALSLFTGVAEGIQPLVSNEYAKHNFKNIKKCLRIGLITSEFIGVICLLFVYFKGNLIIDFFNAASNANVINLAKNGMIILLLSLIFSSLNVVFNIFFSAINNPRASISMVILRGYILPPIIVFFMAQSLGVKGIWTSLSIVEFISLIAEIFTWIFSRKKLKEDNFTIE